MWSPSEIRKCGRRPSSCNMRYFNFFNHFSLSSQHPLNEYLFTEIKKWNWNERKKEFTITHNKNSGKHHESLENVTFRVKNVRLRRISHRPRRISPYRSRSTFCNWKPILCIILQILFVPSMPRQNTPMKSHRCRFMPSMSQRRLPRSLLRKSNKSAKIASNINGIIT